MTHWRVPPEQLHERDIWIIWKAEQKEKSDGSTYWTKIPLHPETGYEGDATEREPGGWTSFESAVEAYERYDQAEGIGFVFPADDLLVGIDLDDVRDADTGEWLYDWVPGMLADFSSYTEVSPSGTGTHTALFGIKPGDRCKKKVEDGAAEIEMYDSDRFFTYTGERLEEYPDEVRQSNDALSEAYQHVFEDVGGDEQVESRSAPDLDLNDEAVLEKARSAKNGDTFQALEDGDDSAHDSDTSRADMAFLSHLAFWTGGDQDQMTRLFRNSARGNREKADRDDYLERTIDAVFKGQTDFYDPGHRADGGTAGSQRRPNSSSGQANSEDSDSLPQPYGFDVREGEYGVWKNEGKDENGEDVVVWDRWTNFQLETVETILHDDEKRATVRVHPAASSEDPYEVMVPFTVFNDIRRFKDNVVTGMTTTFDANSGRLDALRRFVGGQDAPRRIGVEHIGLHSDSWVTANGVIGPDGWDTEPEFAFDGTETPLSRRWELDPEDGSEFNPEAVAEAVRLLPQTRDPERFLPVLAWFYAAPLRPVIMELEGEFNHINVLGDSGAGKTAALSVLWELFGMGGEPLSASATPFSTLMSFASSNALPAWFDEYKPADMSEYRHNQFLEYYRKATRGALESKGQKDMSVKSYALRAPAIVSGEQPIAGPAEERRTIMTTFRTASTAKHSDSREAFAKLAGGTFETNGGEIVRYDGPDLREHARAYYRFVTELLGDRETIEQLWHDSAERVSTILGERDAGDDLHALVEQGLQTVVFGIEIYRRFAASVDVDVTAVGVTDEVVDNAIGYLIDDHGRDRAGHSSHTDRLLGLVARAAAEEYLEEGEHYAFVNEGKADELLCLKLSRAFDLVRRYARDHDVRGEDLLDTASDYRSRFRDLADTDGTPIIDASKQVRGLNRTLAIDVGRAMHSVEGFDRDLFNRSNREPNEHVGYGVDPDLMNEAIEAADAKLGEPEPAERSYSVHELPPDDARGRDAEMNRVTITLREACEGSQEQLTIPALCQKLVARFDHLHPSAAKRYIRQAVSNGRIRKGEGGKVKP